MLRKIVNSFLLLLTSGILLHRCTLIGILCGIWVYFGAEVEESAFRRMLTPDLYLFMSSFLIFYRFLFKKILKSNGELDLQAMFICFLGDLAWAVTAMFCTVPFFMMFNYSGSANYAQNVRAAAAPHSLMRQVPKL
ncbi:MAG: hypothetical protein IJ752_07175 [Alphaproteobacteria bacterium]|nr:hypothetical protein [Alphaproteobacteria bacterium]